MNVIVIKMKVVTLGTGIVFVIKIVFVTENVMVNVNDVMDHKIVNVNETATARLKSVVVDLKTNGEAVGHENVIAIREKDAAVDHAQSGGAVDHLSETVAQKIENSAP